MPVGPYSVSPSSSARVNMVQLTGKIIAAAIKIHRQPGPGLLESAYEACLAYELERDGLRVERQKPVPVIYNTVKLDCGFRADLVVEGRVAVELKCKEQLHPVDYAQTLSHIRLLALQVRLLINFHVVLLKDGIKRIVNNYQEDSESIESLRGRRTSAEGAERPE
jgi:GxxExxY protein